MQKITKAEWGKIHSDFKGIWTTERWDWKNWEKLRQFYVGKRTLLSNENGGSVLLLEGVDFEIVEF